MKKYLLLCFVFAALTVQAAPFKIARNGITLVHIIVERNAPPVVKTAARELQEMIKMLSTAHPGIFHAPVRREFNHIYIGTLDSKIIAPALKKYPGDRAKLTGNDGYAVRMVKNNLYIYSSDPRGVFNGVHRLIHKNTDFIWVRPNQSLARHSNYPDLQLEKVNYVDIPAFDWRGWSANGNIAMRSEDFDYYIARLGCNSTTTIRENVMRRRKELGFKLEYGGGHNMCSRWLPVKKYGKTNPEYYMMLGGIRRCSSSLTHPCFSNKEMAKVFIANVLEQAAKLPPQYARINVMIEDTNAFCECTECKKPLTLPDGRTITRSHEAYKSTLTFMFLNKIAAALHAKYPKMQLKVYGYFFCAVPPEVKVHHAITVSFCPYVRNDKQTLHGESNARWLKRTVKWTEMCKNVNWREYYYSGAGYPRAQANIIAQDLRFINKRGVKMISPELSWGDVTYRVRDKGPQEQEFFTMCGPEFWTICQLYWDPSQDADELRNEYIKRTYREAAPAVSKFYKIICDDWLKDPDRAAFNDDYRRNMGKLVDRKLVEPCRKALAEAVNSSTDPQTKKLTLMLQQTFDAWVKVAISGAVQKQGVPKVEINGFPGFDFSAGAWQNAMKLPPLQRMGMPQVKPAEPTDIYLMHNGQLFYIGFRCPYPGKLNVKPNRPRDEWISGDRGEIFLAVSDKEYYHFAFDACGNMYDGKGISKAWNGAWQVKGSNKKGEWCAVVMIPFKTFGARIEQNNKAKALFFRIRPGRGDREHSVLSSWDAGVIHKIKEFGELTFSLE